MKVEEKDIASIIEGRRQYIIPLFQRAYVWKKEHCEALWSDIREAYDNNESHFFGAFVVTPIEADDGVKKFLLIDGQQRLTTILLLLSVIRNLAKSNENVHKLVEEIELYYLFNGSQDSIESTYKVLPSQLNKNRASFQSIMHNNLDNTAKNQITEAFFFFDKILKKENQLDLRLLKRVIINKLKLVYIELSTDDDPYRIFESLNATGASLTDADLVRNYFFMRLSLSEQNTAYNEYWNPIQTNLGTGIGDFFRHFLMKDSVVVKLKDVYRTLKGNVDSLKTSDEVLNYLKQLSQFSTYYVKFLNPKKEKNSAIYDRLFRIERLSVTVTYPFLLNVYYAYDEKRITLDEFLEIVDILENFLVRRLICDIPTHGLNRIFPHLYDKAKRHPNLVQGIKTELLPRQYPNDAEFAKNFMTINIYKKGAESIRRTKFILSCLEYFENKEPVSLDNSNISIEHIMPQTLSSKWKDYLGNNTSKIHQKWCDTLGNLTLTASNGELGQKPFQAKKKILEASNLQLNRYFIHIAFWQEEDIQRRAEILKDTALRIWPYFGDEQSSVISDVTGMKPQDLTIQGKKYTPSSWRDVMELTLEAIIDIVDVQTFEQVIVDFPNYVDWENNRFRSSRQLSNNAYIETNLSANDIYDFCRKVIDITGLLENQDWIIEVH
ncbi:DUF262 domain-containing HNH endonuclease family protein [Candidatus Albibeggiatoa sp. nov. BB20]|uniref:DUF262 domain-containing protein n=1 Tax=Candidatus Albibeggiatoa sp. nov. BB20 TaxID=3162723 RepID=UPI0033656339